MQRGSAMPGDLATHHLGITWASLGMVASGVEEALHLGKDTRFD